MMEPKGKARAEVSCRVNLTDAVREKNWGMARLTFEQYGGYLLMTGHGGPVGETRVFEVTRT